jgi:hypothetical protein
MITGKEILALGYKPAHWFKEAIAYANEHQLEGENLAAYLKTIAPERIEPFETPLHFHKNIRAETADEIANVEQVFRSMQVLMKTPTLVDGVVMPDACPTGETGQIPVGGVVAAKNAIHPAMHSADICCSVMMTNFGTVSPKEVLDTAHSVTHFGGGGRPDFSELPVELESRIRDNPFFNNEVSLNFARFHLGTQGDGNHFLFVGTSKKTGETMMVTHHGSRGFGAHLYTQGMKVAEQFRKKISPATLARNACWTGSGTSTTSFSKTATCSTMQKAQHRWMTNSFPTAGTGCG